MSEKSMIVRGRAVLDPGFEKTVLQLATQRYGDVDVGDVQVSDGEPTRIVTVTFRETSREKFTPAQRVEWLQEQIANLPTGPFGPLIVNS